MLRRKADLLFSVLVLLLVVWMVWEARHWPLRARLFPWTIGLPTVAIALLQVGLAVRQLVQARRAAGAPARPVEAPPGEDTAVIAAAVESVLGADAAAEEAIPPAVVRRRTLAMVAWILGFTLGITLLGFRLGGGLGTLAFLKLGARESWKTTLLLTLATYLSFFLLFDVGLNTPLPAGLLADALGVQAFDTVITEPIKRWLTGG
ncbi:MAG TPA: tripartite tricarboxylate transporter TctB family protein [Chloroflexota bacterium]|nr:tripartite tricarboxylate transporter TctB family protein [Chloroflexota bacterium]